MNFFHTVRATRLILSRREWRVIVLATVATVFISILDTAAIALILPLVSLATGGSLNVGVGGLLSPLLGDGTDQGALVALTVAVVILFVLKDIGALGFTWWLSGFKVLRRVQLSSKLLAKFLYSPYVEVSRRGTAELLRTMNDAVLQFYATTVFGLMTIVSNIASLLAIALALFVSAFYPSLFLTLVLGIVGLLYLHLLKPRLKRAGIVTAEASADAYRAAFAALGGLKEAKLRGSQEFFLEGYRQASYRGAYAARTASFISAAPRYLLEILFIVAVGVVLLIGHLASRGGDGAGLGLLALFVAAGFRALPAVTSLLGQLGNLRYGAGFVQVLMDEHGRGPAPLEYPETSSPKTYPAPRTKGWGFDSVELRGVSFAYPGNRGFAIEDIDLELARGSSTALVGSSGAGKTTLIDIILGLYEPYKGHVLVDGEDIRSNLASWQAGIGYVPQEISLREATLAENVAFDEALDDIDEARLWHALEGAQLAQLVSEFPDGVFTKVGERGGGLSGGQRQRVGIARALYREPHLLVLDEATSALDNETEHKVGEALAALKGRVTTIVVAHRLSTVRTVDSVVLMHDGKIEDRASFNELKRRNPRFKRMVELGAIG